MRLIDANELLVFPYSESAGTDEQIEDWIEECGLSDEEVIDRAKKLCWMVIEGFVNVIKTAPTLTLPNEWVSVEERSPKLRENVLVCAYWHEHWGVYMGWNSGHGWYVSCGLGQRSDVKVSHWMPLPAPPDRRPPEGDEDA